MNKEKHNLDLEGLLAEVEHAGRDARRQEELGAMIDSMAGANKHGFWWWTVRVAVAACVLFFVSTAVRIWFIPTDSGVDENKVAGVDLPTIVPPVAVDSSVAIPVAPKPLVRKVSPASVPVAEEDVPEPDLFAEEVAAESAEESEPVPCGEVVLESQEKSAATVDEIAALGVTVDNEATVATANTETTEPAKKAQSRRRESIFKSLFRRDDISKMDGTMFAINLL